MTYNLTIVADNSTDIVGFVQSVNHNLTGDTLIFTFLIGLYVIFMTSFFFSTREWTKSFIASSIICLLLSLLLTAMGLLTAKVTLFFLIATAISVALSFRNSGY